MVASSPATRSCPQCAATVLADHHYCPTCGFPVGNVGRKNEDRFVGRTLPGGYHILDLISVGGMGRVYRAEQSALGRTVAVKIIHPHLLSDENSALRFMTEARAASQLNHPNSIAVFDFGRTDDGQPYLVMEFLRGKDLARVAYEEGPLSFNRIVDVLRQVLAALAEAHELGIVHRDLKPENIVLEPLRRGGDFVKVLDFGLAKLKADTHSPNVTSPGIVCGTPDYMAPEQGRGDPIDGRSDLYGLGVVLFQLLTGHLPFEAESPTQVVMMHLTIPVPDPRQVAPDRHIPQRLVDVVLKALAKQPEQRFQDAQEFSDALARAIRDSQQPSRASVAPRSGSSMIPNEIIECAACHNVVPLAKFCLDCGERLPQRSRPAEAGRPTFPLPLLSREEDLRWLLDRRNEAEESFVGARLVGEAGIGKTRLLREFLERRRNENDLTVWVTPDPYWAEAAYFSLRQAILGLTGLTPRAIETAAFPNANPNAAAGLLEILGGAPRRNDDRTPVERRLALAEALRWAIEKGAELAPVVLAIDELHRIDSPSRRAFADVLGEPPACPALLLAAHPGGFDSGWGSSVARVLTGLPPPVASRLLAKYRTGDEPPESLSRGVLPMYVEQVIRFAMEGGSDPPSRLADLIGRRVDTLEPEARRTLQAVVVLGDRVAPELLAPLVQRGVDLQPILDALRAAGFVELDGDGSVSAAHPLLREVVLGGTPAAVRRELHGKALRACERRAAPLEAQALHALEAQDSFQALLLLEQVAERSGARGDTTSEVLALRRGLDLARQEISRGELDDPLRAVLIFSRKLGAALTRAGDFADAEGVLREALDVAGPGGTDRARVLGALAHVAHARQRTKEALDYIDAAITVARESGAQELVVALSDTKTVWGG